MRIIHDALILSGNECFYYSDSTKLTQNDILVFDECKAAVKFWLKGYKNFHIWMQGVGPEEALMQGYPRYKYWIRSILEFICLKYSGFIYFCSDEMRNHYSRKYHISFSKDKYYIMPCFNEYGIDDSAFTQEKYNKNTFVYLGSLSKWQCFEKTVEVYKKIEEKLDDSKLFVFTEEKGSAIEVLNRYKIKNYQVKHVKADELGDYIKGIKYGFVLREDNIVNRVATPTKLSNYISHGIIPIYSDVLSSFHKYNERKLRLGVVCNVDDLSNGINNILRNTESRMDVDDIIKRCAEAFSDYYGTETHKERIVDLIKNDKQ